MRWKRRRASPLRYRAEHDKSGIWQHRSRFLYCMKMPLAFFRGIPYNNCKLIRRSGIQKECMLMSVMVQVAFL